MSVNSKSSSKEKENLESFLDVEEQESQKGIPAQALLRLVKEVVRHRLLFGSGLILTLLSTATVLIQPRLLGYAIDEAVGPKDWEYLKTLVIIYFAIEVVRASSIIAHSYIFAVLGQKVMQNFRIALFSHLQSLPLSRYDKIPAGKLVTRVTNDISSLAEMFTAGFVTIIGNFLVVFGILVSLFVMNFKLGVIAGSVFPFMMISAYYFSHRLRETYRDSRSKLSSLNAFLAENILGMKVVSLFNRFESHLSRFDALNQWYADAQFGIVKIFAIFRPFITVCMGASIALVIWFGGGMAMSEAISVGFLVAYFTYVSSLFEPIREMTDKWNFFLSGMASVERIYSILDWKVEEGLSEVSKEVEPYQDLKGHIEFKNVWFAYDEEHWILKDFSFQVLPGEKVGIVGPTGSGKTTLISLLMRFYEPQKGVILLDGRDVREYDKRRLRASIGIIQQDVFLFSGSLKDNVSLWREDQGEASGILKELGASSLEDGLESRLNTELLERGGNLSMGEKQVIAFARAMYARPSIWILDEATSNIDSETEGRLEGALLKASQNRTALMIAHRLSTVKRADKILVLNQGRLTEEGTHQELLERGGLYARLYRFQEASI